MMEVLRLQPEVSEARMEGPQRYVKVLLLPPPSNDACIAGLCQKLRVIASDIENMSLASPLETVCRSQIELYINTYDHVLKMAADSALAVQRPDDISSTHLLVLHLTWNKDAGTRIEEQFSFSRADIETNAWYEARVTGVNRKEEEDAINTPGMKRSATFGRDVMLEADFIAGRRLDLPDDSPRILTRILVVVRPTVVGNERIPPIIRRVFHKSDVCVQLSLLNPRTQLTLSSFPMP